MQRPWLWVLPKISCLRVSGTFEVFILRPFGLEINHLGLKRNKGIVEKCVGLARYANPTGEELSFQYSGEEKSLRHVAVVAKFLDNNKPKIHLKRAFALFKTSLILFNFIYFVQKLATFSGVESERTVSKFRKKTTKIFMLCLPTL